MAFLDELGIGDKVRAFAPPVPLFINGVEDARARIAVPPDKRGSCPRRTDLDALLVKESGAAGADVRLRTKLVELVRDGGRIVGAVVEHDGRRESIRCKWLVGADGRNSTVAELVNAEEYHGYDTPRAAYWAYWPRPASYGEDPRYSGAAAIVHSAKDYFFIFPTNKDQLLIGIGFPVERLPEWKGRHREEFFDRVRRYPLTAPLTEGEPLSQVIGILKMRFFFRQAAGPGWALVGDSGLSKDPAPGLGITDAFRDAKALASAICEGSDAAVTAYWRERDTHSIELFEFARQLGDTAYNNPLNHLLFSKLANDEGLRRRIVAVQNREISPFAAFSPGEVIGWCLGALLRGKFGVVAPFLAAGKHGGEVKKELGLRRRLLDEARAGVLAP